MNNNLKKIMNQYWIAWHGEMPFDKIPFNESCNPSFREGFKTAFDVLSPMLKEANIVVQAHADSLHMLDGFAPKRDNEWDRLAREICKLIDNDEYHGPKNVKVEGGE